MCICSKLAVENYNLKVIKEIHNENNYTKFSLISKNPTYSGERSLIIFTIENKPGSLYKVLRVFYEGKINLSMIYSRPLFKISKENNKNINRKMPWEYYFYLEYEGPYIDRLIKKLENITEKIKFKGSYNIIF